MLAASLSLALLQAPPATVQPTPAAPSTPPTSPPPATAPPALPPDGATQPTAPPPAIEPSATADPFAAPPPATAPPPAYPPGYYPYYPYPPPPAPATAPPSKAPGELPESATHRRLVFHNFYALNFGMWPIPSGEVSFFLGSNLKPRRNLARTFDWNTALGYQLTLSLGYADTLTQGFSFDDEVAIFIHRHHFTASGYGGAKQRLYYSVGGGVWMAGTSLMGIEAEGRLGRRFAIRDGSRVSGVVGGQVRLGGAINDIPLPQFGLFIGFLVF